MDRYQWKEGTRGMLPKCDEVCRKRLHCDSYYGFNEHKMICNDKNFNYMYLFDFALGSVLNPWVTTFE